MKTYAVFAGTDYYPLGGWDDLLDTFNTLEEASQCADSFVKKDKWRWAQVVNLQNGKKVSFGDDADVLGN